MEKLTTFIAGNYIIFIILSIVAIFALIGYFTNPNDQALSMFKRKPKEEKDTDLAKSLKEIEAIKDKHLNQTVNTPDKEDVPKADQPKETKIELSKEEPKEEVTAVEAPKKEIIKEETTEEIDTLAFDDPLILDEPTETKFKA